MQERLHKEIRLRSRVVGIFPSVDSYLLLITAYAIEYADDWATSGSSINTKDIEDQEAERRKVAENLWIYDGCLEEKLRSLLYTNPHK